MAVGSPDHIAQMERIQSESTPRWCLAVPSILSYLTEALLAAAFKLLAADDIRIPIQAIIEAIRPWMGVIRLLPKAGVCAADVPPQFNYFSPWHFLRRLMEVTSAIHDDQFRSIASLWIELLKSPDHAQTIPLFVIHWEDFHEKQRLLQVLLDADPANVGGRLAIRCTFGYYYHVTRRSAEFDSELWFVRLLAHAFDRNWSALASHLPCVLHFACIFHARGATRLFDLLAQRLNPQSIEFSVDGTSLASTIKARSSPDALAWGNEALKWVLGCSSTELAAKSFAIYNALGTPFEDSLVPAITRTVFFHLENHPDETVYLAQFVSQAFVFFTANLRGIETYAFDFVSAFFDCPIFVETSLIHAHQIFVECLPARTKKGDQAYNTTLPMIRALIPHLESSDEAQEIMDQLIRRLEDMDLMMIALPIKMNFPDFFPSCPDSGTILGRASDFHCCTALLHYSTMMQRASREVLNSIFELSIMIVSRVQNDNNRMALSKIYQQALRSMADCPMAIKFIQKIVTSDARVATMEVVYVQEWDRTLDDVARSLKRLIPSDEVIPIVTISDCHSYQNVMGFLFSGLKTAILPFAPQSEMLDGMTRVAREHQPHSSIPKTLAQADSWRKTQSNFTRDTSYEDVSFMAYLSLHHPERLIDTPKAFASKKLPSIPCSRAEFIAALAT
jgi:hypothetical protein